MFQTNKMKIIHVYTVAVAVGEAVAPEVVHAFIVVENFISFTNSSFISLFRYSKVENKNWSL